MSSPIWDVFISHASEDTGAVARPLAQELERRGLNVWLDENTLSVGDSLRRQIDRGLANSRYGVVILSPDFFRKNWPQMELDALVARDDGKEKVILPVWHHLTPEQVVRYSPLIAGKLAASTAQGIDRVANEIMRGMGRARPNVAPQDLHLARLAAIRQQILLAYSAWDLQRLNREIDAFLYDYPGDAAGLQLKDQVTLAIRKEERMHPPTGAAVQSRAPTRAPTRPAFASWGMALASVLACVLVLAGSSISYYSISSFSPATRIAYATMPLVTPISTLIIEPLTPLPTVTQVIQPPTPTPTPIPMPSVLLSGTGVGIVLLCAGLLLGLFVVLALVLIFIRKRF